MGQLCNWNIRRFVLPYDMDKQEAIKTRKKLLQYARENGLVIAGMHLPVPAFIK